MPVDKENLKKALDDFENDDFISSKEKIKDEIKKARDEYIEKKTGVSLNKEKITKDGDGEED